MLTLYNSAGVPTLDGSRRIAKFLGELTIGGVGSAQSGSITHSSLNDAQPFAFQLTNGQSADNEEAATISFSGITLNWSFPEFSSRPETRIVYGII